MAQAIQHCPPQNKTYEFKARQLAITWGNDCRYLQWEKSPCSCDEYAMLKQVWWLDVEGKIATSKLPPCVPYKDVFELEMTPCAQGWSKPVHLELNVPGQCPKKMDVCIDGEKGKKFELSLGRITTQACACGDISFKFYEYSDCLRKTGLIVEKAIVRPIMRCDNN